MDAVQKLLDVARAEIGYIEKTSNSQLDDKTANQGSGNYTKYAKDLYSAKYYGGSSLQSIAWCDTFVDWCFWKAFGAEAGLKLTCQTLSASSALCATSMNYYKAAGQFYTSPQPGDQIFFYSSKGGIGHTGIVETVTGSKITTIEGNSSNKVANRTYTVPNSSIAGYGRPDFAKILGSDYSYNGSSNGGSGYTWVFTGSSEELEKVTQYTSGKSLYSVIDVSYCQSNLNWDLVKGAKPADTAGNQPKPVSAAIIRAGYGKTANIDSTATRHVQGCVKHNIPFGLYWYASGYNSGDAAAAGKQFAENIYNFYNNLSADAKALCTFPLFIDIEEHTYNRANELATAYAFCMEIIRRGCVPGVYASAGRCNGWINDLSSKLDSTTVDFSYTDTSGATVTKKIYKGDLMYCKWIAEWKCGVNSTFNFGSWGINPPIGLWQQWGDIEVVPGKMYLQGSGHTSNIDVNNCYIDYANAGMYSEPSVATLLQENTDYVLFTKVTDGNKSKILYATHTNRSLAEAVFNTNTKREYFDKVVEATDDISTIMNNNHIFTVKKVSGTASCYYICPKGQNKCLAVNCESVTSLPGIVGPMPKDTLNTQLALVDFDPTTGKPVDAAYATWATRVEVLKGGNLQFIDSVSGQAYYIKVSSASDAGGNNYIVAAAASSGTVALSLTPKKVSISNGGSGGGNVGETYGWDASAIAAALLAADDSASRESIHACLNTYADVDLEDYADFNDSCYTAGHYSADSPESVGTILETCSVDIFEGYLDALRGLLSHSPISSVSAQTEINNVTDSYSKLVYKTPYNGYRGEFVEAIGALQEELTTAQTLKLSDYTGDSQELLSTVLSKAKALPLSFPTLDPGNGTSPPKLSDYKKLTNALKDAQLRLQAVELDLDKKVKCGTSGSFSYNDLKALMKNLKEDDFTKKSFAELTSLVNTPLNKSGGGQSGNENSIGTQSELEALVAKSIGKMSSLSIKLADCSKFFQARLDAAAVRDSANRDLYLNISVTDTRTWADFLENGTPKDKLAAAVRRYNKTYTAASRERVDNLCDAFDKIVNIDASAVSSSFAQLYTNSPIVLQSDVDLLTAELNSAVAGLVMVQASSAENYLSKIEELQDIAQTPGITEEAKEEIYGIISGAYTSDLSAANEEIIAALIQAILDFLANLNANGGVKLTPADFTEYNKIRAVAIRLDPRRYSSDSFAVLTEALNIPVYGYSVLEQAEVDSATTQIKNALSALKLREDPLTLFFIRNSDGTAGAEHVKLKLENKVCKENIDIVTAVYANKVNTEANPGNRALYYIDDVEQLKRALSTHKNIYFKLRSFLKNSTSAEKVGMWTYSHQTTSGAVASQEIELAYGCIYVNTGDSGIRVYEPDINNAIFAPDAVAANESVMNDSSDK